MTGSSVVFWLNNGVILPRAMLLAALLELLATGLELGATLELGTLLELGAILLELGAALLGWEDELKAPNVKLAIVVSRAKPAAVSQ